MPSQDPPRQLSTGIRRGSIHFTSELPVSRRAEVERLVFFNDNQHRVDRPLREALHRYGVPQMVSGEKLIRFSVPSFPEVQSLYALDLEAPGEPLAAVSIYTREDEATLSVLFLALHEAYADRGALESKMVGAWLLDLIRADAARTRGIATLRLSYHPRDLRIPIRR